MGKQFQQHKARVCRYCGDRFTEGGLQFHCSSGCLMRHSYAMASGFALPTAVDLIRKSNSLRAIARKQEKGNVPPIA